MKEDVMKFIVRHLPNPALLRWAVLLLVFNMGLIGLVTGGHQDPAP
jgi:hypothetical protein